MCRTVDGCAHEGIPDDVKSETLAADEVGKADTNAVDEIASSGST